MATRVKPGAVSRRRLPGIRSSRLLAAYEDARRFLRREYVTGVAIGSARRSGQVTDEIAICVYVDAKRPLSELSRAQQLPRSIRGVPLDVVQLVLEPQFVVGSEGRARRETRVATLQPGLQIKTAHGDVGTIALAARPRNGGPGVIVTAGHVAGSTGAQVFQPFGNAPEHRVGKVTAVSLAGLDAGCVSIAGRTTSNLPFGSATPITRVRKAREGDSLQMSGAFSGTVQGVVRAIGETKTIFPGGSGAPRTLVGFFLNPPPAAPAAFTEGGDSGALWFDGMGAAVGVHVAGGFDKGVAWAFACDMGQVLDVLGLSL